MREKTIKVFEVLFYDERSPGAAADCHHVRRFRKRAEADTFAAGRTCYGSPAEVHEVDAPMRLARRWGLA